MSAVVNMQQRRTLATGRQNQDPNTVVGEKEHTPKKICPKIERSIQEVLNHTRNTSGRGRQMALAALQKKAQAAAEKKTPPSASKTSQSGGKKTPVSAKTNGDLKRSPLTSRGSSNNKLSVPDIRKRPLDQAEQRAPLSALNATAQSRPEKQYSDWTSTSPAKPSQKDGTLVYKKRPKTEATPPPQDSTSSDISSEPFSPKSRQPIVKQTAETGADKPSARRQLMTPSPAKEASDPHKILQVRTSLEVAKPPSELCVESEPQEIEVEAERRPVTFISKSPTKLFVESEPQEKEAELQPLPFIAKSPKRLHGLMNLGNTCYMNVIVQILFSLPSFVAAMELLFIEILKQDAAGSKESETPSSPHNDSVYAALLHVFRDLKRAGRYETVNPSVLKLAFAKQQSSFWGCIQQDAHEFFCSLIDYVQEDVSSLLRRQFSNQADRPKLETVCPTTQNFSCTVRNSLTCAECGNVSSVEETYRDFSLALPEDERTDETRKCSLESLLRLYFQETTMSRKCEKCGGDDAKAQAQILRLPHILVLQLKRLHMDRDIPCTKLSSPVNFTSHLDIGPWCAQDKQKFWSPTTTANSTTSERVESGASTHKTAVETRSDAGMDEAVASSFELQSQGLLTNSETGSSTGSISTRYSLHGVVNHLGHHASGGHFITDIRDAEANRWLRCDDSLVMDVPADSVFDNVREAYMFFYVHEPEL